MPKGLFITGFTVAEVLAIQTKAKTMLTEGKTVMSWSAGDASGSKQFTMPIDEVLMECRLALRTLDPNTYGRRITKTVARFN